MNKGWVAGIIDGEGCLGIYKNGKTTKRPLLQVGNTDIKIINELKKCGGIFYETTNKKRPRSKRIWVWKLYGGKLLDFLIVVEPYLISKKEKANELINFYKKNRQIKH